MPATTTTTQAVSPGYIYTVTASSETIVRSIEPDKLLCKANNGRQGMFIAIGGTVSMTTDDPTATITQASATSGGARFEVQQTRPATGEEGVIYLIPITSSADEENEYEEWIWIKGEWERLGTTGVNLSNYATLTDANTYSGNNTFNGLLLKSNSASLGDTSVLNRSEADARYGRLAEDNTWNGAQYIGSAGILTIHSSTAIVTNNIQGNAGNGCLSFNGLHLTNIVDIDANTLKIDEIRAAQSNNKIIFASSTGSGSVNVSGINELSLASIRAEDHIISPTIKTNAITPISGGSVQLQGINELVATNTASLGPQATLSGIRYLKYADNTIDLGYSEGGIAIDGSSSIKFLEQGSCIEIEQGIISGVQTLKNDNVELILDTTLDRIIAANTMLVAAPNGIKVAGNVDDTPAVTMSLYGIEAFSLDTDSFGQGKYGLRLTPESCQLFGIDFNSNSSGSIAIGNSISPIGTGSVAIGDGNNAGVTSVGIGAVVRAKTGATALGYGTNAAEYGIAIGTQCTAVTGTLNISTGAGGTYGARCSMLWYGGTSYEDRDTTGYLSFEIGNTVYNDRAATTAQNDTITISKPNLWSALDRAKYRGAQPYAYYIASAIASIPALEPNSITHIGTYSSGEAIDLSGITLAEYNDAITTAELWIEVASAGTTITWPNGTLWPDEADPTIAPSFSGPEASTEAGYITQRLYCVTLRTQRRRNISDGTNNPVLIASIAYAVDSKLPNV